MFLPNVKTDDKEFTMSKTFKNNKTIFISGSILTPSEMWKESNINQPFVSFGLRRGTILQSEDYKQVKCWLSKDDIKVLIEQLFRLWDQL